MTRLQRMQIHGLLMALLLYPALAGAAFPGRPLLLSAEGGGAQAAWVAYENGDVLRCRAEHAACQAMSGLPGFSSPVSLSAEPDGAAAWVGWSDGALYRCQADGNCKVVRAPDDSGLRRRMP